MDATTALVEIALPTLASVALVVWFRSPRDVGGVTRVPTAAWWALFAMTRLVYPVLLFVWLDFDGASDSWFWKKTSAAGLEGQVPGVDYAWPYGQLLARLQIWGRAIVPGEHWIGALLPFVAGDALAVAAGPRLARLAAPSLHPCWVLGWLVITPLLWHQLVVRGQDESIFVGMLVVAALAASTHRGLLCGVLLGLGLLVAKVTILPFAAALVGALAPRPRAALRAVAGALAVAVPGFLLMPASFPSDPVRENTGVGISAVDLLGRVTGLPFAALIGVFGAAALALTALIVTRGHTLSIARRAVLALAAMQCVVMLFMPACRSPYLAQGVVPVLIVVASLSDARWRGRACVLLIVLGSLAALLWTELRVFTASTKVLSLVFHAGLLSVCVRELVAGDAQRPAGSAGAV